MSYVITATRRWGRAKRVRYYGDSSWHADLFDSKVQSYKSESAAEGALNRFSDRTFNDLVGHRNTPWDIEICPLRTRVPDNMLKSFYREFIEATSKRTGLNAKTIRKRYKELIGSK